jgi:hypothetical protein
MCTGNWFSGCLRQMTSLYDTTVPKATAGISFIAQYEERTLDYLDHVRRGCTSNGELNINEIPGGTVYSSPSVRSRTE